MRQVGLGEWWRCSEYTIDYLPRIDVTGGAEIQNRAYIRAVDNPTIEAYIPLLDGRSGRSQSTLSEEALSYKDFVDLALDINDNQKILDFCQRFGLLGLLQHRTLSISHSPRPVLSERAGNKPVIPFMVPTQITYMPIGNMWSETINQDLDLPEPHVICRQTPFTSQVRNVPINEHMRHYFPSVKEQDLTTTLYPLPNTNLFWEHYSEPLDEFKSVIEGFVELLAKLEHVSDENDILELSIQMNNLNKVNSMICSDRSGAFFHKMSFKSLIAIGAHSVVDNLGGGILRRCRFRHCRKFFITKNTGKVYCTQQHSLADYMGNLSGK
jgi:hypothetical protein